MSRTQPTYLMTPDERRLEKIEERLDSLSADLQDIKLAVARIEAKQCPAPGTCIPSAARIERLERGLVGLAVTALCGCVAFMVSLFKT